MLRAEDFNTVFHYFLQWVLFFDRAPAINRQALQAHSLMLSISQPAQMCRRDVKKRSDVFQRKDCKEIGVSAG